MLAEVAKERVQAGPSAPAWRLTLSGREITDTASEIEVVWGEEGSELTCDAVDMDSRSVDERVVLWLGYGSELVPYFSGHLKRPAEGGVFFSRKAQALGPLSRMAEREYMEQVSYAGAYIGTALYDTALRADNPRGTVEVVDPRSYRIDPSAEEAIFVEEVKLSEGAETLMGFAEFVAADVPGTRYGKTIFLPRPRPGAGQKASVTYGPDHYAPKGFKPTPKDEGPYSEVIVFRRDPDGRYAVYQRAPIENRGLKRQPKDRPYRITDFAGDATQARQTAYDTARALGAGEFGFDLELLSINPELARFDRIEVTRLDSRPDGTHRETWACLVEEITASVASWTMSVKGGAVLAKEERVARPVIVVEPSGGVLRTAPWTMWESAGTWDTNETWEG